MHSINQENIPEVGDVSAIEDFKKALELSNGKYDFLESGLSDEIYWKINIVFLISRTN